MTMLKLFTLPKAFLISTEIRQFERSWGYIDKVWEV